MTVVESIFVFGVWFSRMVRLRSAWLSALGVDPYEKLTHCR